MEDPEEKCGARGDSERFIVTSAIRIVTLAVKNRN